METGFETEAELRFTLKIETGIIHKVLISVSAL